MSKGFLPAPQHWALGARSVSLPVVKMKAQKFLEVRGRSQSTLIRQLDSFT